MKRILAFFILAALGTAHADPLINSWFTANTGQYARIYTSAVNRTNGVTASTWTGQTSPVYAGVNEINYSASWVYIRNSGMASFVMGPWNNQNLPKNQAGIWRFPRNVAGAATVSGGQSTLTPMGSIGFLVDGVSLYNTSDGYSYTYSSLADAVPPSTAHGDGIWNRDALPNESVSFDYALAHNPPSGEYHSHANPIATRYLLGDNVTYNTTTKNYAENLATTNFQHSPIIGWMKDGLPLYGPYGYDGGSTGATANATVGGGVVTAVNVVTGGTLYQNPPLVTFTGGGGSGAAATAVLTNGVVTSVNVTNGGSGYTSAPTVTIGGVRRMISGYQLRDGTNGSTNTVTATGGTTTLRTSLPVWALASRTTAPNTANPTLANPSQYGPATTYTSGSGQTLLTYTIGHYAEDYAYLGDAADFSNNTYVQGSRNNPNGVFYDLNKYNARFCVTPEYPNGTWAYFETIKADGNPTYPYHVGRWFYGNPTGGSVTSITETVTQQFIGGANTPLTISNTPTVNSGTVSLTWTSVEGGTYSVDASTNQSSGFANKVASVASGGIATSSSYAAIGSSGTEYARVNRTALATYDSTGQTASTVAQTSPSKSYSAGVTNTAPTISAISGQSTLQDTATGAIAFTIDDAETAAASLTVSGASSNTTLVPNANITFGGSGANRTVTITPANGQTGTSTITVTVSDGTLTANTAFTLTVTANTPPTISSIGAATVMKNNATSAISFTVGDVETAAASLTVSATSSNTPLVPNSNISFGGSGANRTVTVTPASGQVGTATITVTVSDGTTTTSTTFTVTVQPPNILLIIADDLGLDALSLYSSVLGNSGTVQFPPTPTIASLAANGVQFNHAYTYTVCSPSRASILTGRFGYRTGVGNVVAATSNNFLQATEFTLPRAFSANSSLNYQLKHFGKWHLSAISGANANLGPWLVGGWPAFSGSLPGQLSDFYNWTKVLCDSSGASSSSTSTTYETTDLVNDAITFINTQTTAGKPWFTTVAFNAPHITSASPFYQLPPTTGEQVPTSPTNLCPNYFSLPNTTADIQANPRNYFDAMIQAMDTEMGRLLANVDLTKTDVIFVGDNGTYGNSAPNSGSVIQSPFSANKAKATLYEGGIRVPLIIRGPDVVSPGRTTDALTHFVDLYSTILEMAGINVAATVPSGTVIDSHSLLPVLQNTTSTQSSLIYGEEFDIASPTLGGRCLRDTQYKLIRKATGVNTTTDEFYDLLADPNEATNLIASGTGSLTAPQLTAYNNLVTQLGTFNTPPTISAIANQSVALNTATSAIPVTVGDAEMSPAILTVTGASSNTTLVPTANVVIGGSGANRTVTVTPATGQTGVSTITVSVTDGTFTTNSSFTVTVGSVTVVGTPGINPAAPTNTDPVVVSANVTPASGRTITGISLQYNSSTPATSTVFYETMASAAIASPWTGTGTNAAWTVIPPTGAPYSQTAAANNTPIAIANPSFGMELNGGAPPPINGNTRITTTNTINAATISGNATTSGYVEFYMMTANLSGTMGWDFQTSPDGTTWTTRLSELTGSNHVYPATPYHYDLTTAERVSTLQLRFRFAGTGPTGTTISKFSLDDIKVVTSTASSPATIAMTGPSGGGVWTATIPAQAAGTVLNYTITATDSASATATNTGTYTVTTAAPVLAVTPATTLSSAGAAGSGIYTPSSIAYTLTNTGTGTMNWTAANTQSWLNLSTTSGTLAAGGSTTVTASINVANANALSANTYTDTITFTNSYNGTGNTTRAASLLVTNGTPTAPAPPVLSTLPLFSAGTSKTILWPAVATATSYTLQIASSANFTTNLLSSQTVATPYATFTNLADGVTYYYRVLATNSVGSSAYSNTVFSTQDTGAPTVAITSPARGTTTVANTITVTGTASDSRSGISGVTVNNVAATSGNSFANWSATVPLGFGTNVITATATDGAGNQATTFATSLTSAVTVTMTTPQTYNPLIIPDTITGTTFNLDLYQVNKQFPTWSAANPVLGINPSATLGSAPGTTTLGYNGALMWGPTLIMNKGDTVQLNVTNHLDQSSSTLLRSTTTTVHWHGFHIPAIMDGGPRQVIAAGMTWSPTFQVKNDAATFWYHPHLHMATQEQLTLGAGGMIIVRDPNEASLNLPRTYGVDDIPLAVTTRRFLSPSLTNEFSANQYVQSDGSTSSTDNYGDYVLVNGTMNPQISLPKQFVRLRILCADIQRGYRIGFSDNRNFYVIANDQGLLNTPQLVSQVTMMIGERVEILVDLSGDNVGNSIDLMAYDNLGAAGALSGSLGGFGGSESPSTAPNGNVGRENGGLLCNSDFKLVHINVAAPTANAVTSVPATLANYTYWTDGQQTNTRVINIANGNGGTPGFTFDSIAYSPTYNNFNIPLNAIEEWKINGGQVFGHSLHIHDIKFKIVARGTTNIQAANGVITGNTNQIFDTVNNNGGTLIGSKACANYESGWKDTVYVPRGETVWVIAKYDDFASPNNPYMLHCHMLNHEDGGLMGQFVVTSAATDAIAVASVTRTGSNGVINFQFNTTPGTSFLVQYSPDMTTGSWTTIGTTTGNSDGSGASFTEADATRLGLPRGFYRAVMQTVVTPPVITSATTATAMHGVFSSNIYTITATNNPTGFSAILDNLVTNTHVPGGITVNPGTGVISGTPTTAGTYNIDVMASNSGGTAHKTIVLTVN